MVPSIPINCIDFIQSFNQKQKHNNRKQSHRCCTSFLMKDILIALTSKRNESAFICKVCIIGICGPRIVESSVSCCADIKKSKAPSIFRVCNADIRYARRVVFRRCYYVNRSHASSLNNIHQFSFCTAQYV